MQEDKKKKSYPKPKPISLDLQIYSIKKSYKNFRYSDGCWFGELTPNSITYKVKIKYRYKKSPKVFVIDPKILKNAPHRYSDNSLCLYYPYDKDFSNKFSFISDTIIPWTMEWLYLYELWLVSGVWWGKEAPHTKVIKNINNMEEFE